MLATATGGGGAGSNDWASSGGGGGGAVRSGTRAALFSSHPPASLSTLVCGDGDLEQMGDELDEEAEVDDEEGGL